MEPGPASFRCFLMLGLSLALLGLASGCGSAGGKALPISSTRSSEFLGLGSDELSFTNDSDIVATHLTATLTLIYSEGARELTVAWSRWESGEQKRITIPTLKGLQKYSLKGKLTAFRNGKEVWDYQSVNATFTVN